MRWLFWEALAEETAAGEVVDDFESLGALPELDYKDLQIALFSLPPGDEGDFAEVHLVAGEIYDFFVVGEVVVDLLGIFDQGGYSYWITDGDDAVGPGFDSAFGTAFARSSGNYSYSNADSIVDFEATYTGGYYILIENPGYSSGDMMILVGTKDEYIQDSFIVGEDNSNWDNDVYQGGGHTLKAEDAQLYRAYMGAMGRLPDADGFNWWANQIETGRKDLSAMADGFIASPEFKGYADTNHNGYISNHEFVSHMYEGVFGRSPDQGGYDYWMSELNSGASDQAEVLVYMTQSNEYIDQTLDTVADYLFS